MGIYLRPETLPEALRALADPALAGTLDADRLTVLAGGTDVYPARAQKAAWCAPGSRNIIDISGLDELKGIRFERDGIVIGALTTWSAVCDASLPPACDGLKRAARAVGGVQVQNRGTVGGNICNASPAADGVPPLLTLDAVVEIASARGRRRTPLAEFITGNRATALSSDELVIGVRVPNPGAGARSSFLKLGARAYLVISIVSVAAVVEMDEHGRIARAAVAIGACSAVPQRVVNLEYELVGLSPRSAVDRVAAQHLAALTPIDDVRGSAAYRRDAALVLVRRVLAECLEPKLEAAA